MTATGSARSTGRIRSYGADRVIDYAATPLLQAVAGQRFDVVLNLVRTSPEETASSGPGRRRRRLRQHHHPRSRRCRAQGADNAGLRPRPQLGELVARVDAGDLKIDVAQRRRLTDLPAVHDQAAAGQLPGKTILTP